MGDNLIYEHAGKRRADKWFRKLGGMRMGLKLI